MNIAQSALAVLVSVSIAQISAVEVPTVTPLTRAHAHNDYEHKRPLFDALDNGFCSIEADIFLINGQLLVAHDRSETRPERTLQALYLDPLRARIRQNGGRLYQGGPPAVLLIDVKTEAEPTYQVLRQVLEEYQDIFTRFSKNEVQTNALTAIISGNRSERMLAEDPVRYAALDGRPEDLNGGASKELIPLVSEDWKQMFRWPGTGTFPLEERKRLQSFTAKAHQQGRRVRFWGTPDSPEMWRALLEGGVDLLNADDLPGLRDFFLRMPFTSAK